jgi:hypothetical protein
VRRHALLALVASVATGAACEDRAPPALQVRRDTVGDTVVIRTLAGNAWGADARLEPQLRIGVLEGDDFYMFGQVRALAVGPDGCIYVVDSQVPALRKYAPDGSYIATFGREGGGPGEYADPDGGLAVLDDGRVVLRDPGNGRFQVYAPDGEPRTTWRIRGNFNTSRPLVVDTAGRVYTLSLVDPGSDTWQIGLMGHDSETGEPIDTLAAPAWDYEEPELVARQEMEWGMNSSSAFVPFSPVEHWALSPLGYMVGGLSTRYAIDQYLPDGTVLRVERVLDPVPVAAGEKADAEADVRWILRQTQPDWTWNGPAIPDAKPPFRDLYVGKDGRIWVLLSMPGERIPDDQLPPPGDRPDPRPGYPWREPVAFDVFEPDGTYLGRVDAPGGIALTPEPVFDGDRVWAVVRDELDVQYVTRFRVALAARASSGG